jgi:hypothetical protein
LGIIAGSAGSLGKENWEMLGRPEIVHGVKSEGDFCWRVLKQDGKNVQVNPTEVKEAAVQVLAKMLVDVICK